MSTPSLQVVAGPAAGGSVSVGAELLIGREIDGGGGLGGDPELSRRHARVSLSGGRLAIEDLGSTNGTRVNGRAIDGVTPLRGGDTIEVGSTTLRVEPGPEAAVTAARPRPLDVTAARPVAAPVDAAAADGARVRVVAGRASGTSAPISDEPFAIGRAVQGPGGLGGDPELSSRHAEISRSGELLVIEDLGSTNGTFVNGRRIPAPTVIEPGDAIWVGTTTLIVTNPAAPVLEVAPAEPPPPAAGGSGLLSRLADLSDRNPKRILAGVAAFFVVAVVFGATAASRFDAEDAFNDPDSESVVVDERIGAATGEEPGPQLIAVVTSGEPVEAPATRRRVRELAGRIGEADHVTRTATFYDTDNRAFVSSDGRSTFIAAFYESASESAIEESASAVAEEIESAPEVLVGGPAIAGAQIGEQVGKDLGKAEGLAFPILFALMIFVFRGLVAALLPLCVAALTVFTTFFVLRWINEILSLSEFALNVVIALGLGLAIDYSLFVVSRYREELAKVGEGRPASGVYGAIPRAEAGKAFIGTESEALRRTILTAGRTILYSAVTVAIALATLTLFPQPFIKSMGIGGAVTALVAVTVALVVLPALLALLGPRINSLAPRRWKQSALQTAGQERGGGWYKLSQMVMRRPATVAIGSAAFLIFLGLPAAGINFTGVDTKSIPRELTSRQVDDLLARDFTANPANEVTVLLEAPRDRRTAVERLAGELRALPGAEQSGAPPQQLEGGLWTFGVLPARGTLDDASIDLAKEIRARDDPFPVATSGPTSAFIDERSSISRRLPLALAILAALTAVVLFLMTGSVVLPIKALLMNVLSVGAAFGILVFIFQDGHFEGLLGFESPGAIELSQPVLLVAIAFGLATDYAVFLLTRIKEARTAGASEADAVAIGIERTGRIVTQAALLFCVAIGAFATSSVIFIKEVGVGTAFAVILDATIIRAFLVPSLMALLGARNWWAPGPLRRLHNKIGLSEG